MKNIFLLTLLICVAFLTSLKAQVGEPCDGGGHDDEVEYENVFTYANVGQSSTESGADAQFAIDGRRVGSFEERTVARTRFEENPYWEADLGKVFSMKGIQIIYNEREYERGLDNIYILFSEEPFRTTNLEQELASPTVKYVFVERGVPNGEMIPLDNQKAQYFRIQLAKEGYLSFVEIVGPGGGGDEEICGNGIDDDCDGKIDCEDSDCGPQFVNVNGIDPTCPICDDGQITIQATDPWDIQYSMDGGVTFVDLNPRETNSSIHLFDNLPEGTYEIVITNGSCTNTYSVDVVLEAPAGSDDGDCPNGGFEEGDFTGWTGGVTNWSNQAAPVFTNTTFTLNDQHTIIPSSNASDPNVPNITFNPPNAGTYLVRLGNAGTGADAERLDYCFIVDNDNADFFFNYAVVLQDPGHPAGEQPFFQFTIRNNTTGQIILQETHISDVDDPFFLRDGNIAYKGWTCVPADLSAHIGDEVCVEFITADCEQGGHFGYAYLDGFCSNLEDFIPTAALDINDVYCQNQTVDADGTGSIGFNTYFWEICKFGNPAVCYTTPETIGFANPQLDDVLTLFFDQNGGSPQCGDEFRVTLNLANDCASTSTFQDFEYICEESTVDYLDIIACSGNMNIQMIGVDDYDCSGCDASWSPSGYLSGSQNLFPTVMGTLNTNAIPNVYSYEITNQFDCIYEGEVDIMTTAEFMGDITFQVDVVDHCELAITATLELDEPVHSNSISFTFTYDNDTYDGILISPSGTFDSHTYQLPFNVSRNEDVYIIARSMRNNLPPNVHITGPCQVQRILNLQNEDQGQYFGDIEVYFPNVFSPNASNPENQTFGPFFNTNELNVIGARLSVYDRWGGLMFDSDWVTAPMNGTGLTGQEAALIWDGTVNGQPAQSGVYVWVCDYYNCDTALSGCFDCDVWDIDDEDCGSCNEAAGHYGDVTLIY